MGPYCKFCDNRCFVNMPMATPKHILKAYGTSSIIATCKGGQEFEKERVGYCYDDVTREIALEELEKLKTVCEKLLDYRRKVGALNFRVEKADDYLNQIRAILDL